MGKGGLTTYDIYVILPVYSIEIKMSSFHKFLGATLLVVGTSIGGAMLALPTVIAAPGMLNSIGLFLLCWSSMTIAAFCILEVNLLFPENSNLISMARETLGNWFGYITWIIYLLLLYTLLSSYVSATGDILFNLTNPLFAHSIWLDISVVGLGVAFLIFKGITIVDGFNRALLLLKLLLFIFLVAIFADMIHFDRIMQGEWYQLPAATLVVITSFGYAIIVPSIRGYLDSNIKLIRKAMLVGSLLPLIFYLIWCFVIVGVLPIDGNEGLEQLATADHSVYELVRIFAKVVDNTLVKGFAISFYALCVLTSLLGISLCLADFLYDGFSNVLQHSVPKGRIAILSLVPPVIVAALYPKAFIMGFSLAGYWVIYILIILPVLMVWTSRYVLKIPRNYQVWGGKPLLILEMVIAILFLVITFTY